MVQWPMLKSCLLLLYANLCVSFAVDTPCECHKQAECYNDAEGAKYCVCKLGFKGDGYSCVGLLESFDITFLINRGGQ